MSMLEVVVGSGREGKGGEGVGTEVGKELRIHRGIVYAKTRRLIISTVCTQ